jgi:transposase-like protein
MSAKKATKGRRYTPAEKKKVVDFVNEHNAANGRGGQSEAAKKFNISQLTIAKWLKQGVKGGSPSSTPAAASGSAAESAPKAKKAAKKGAKKGAKKAAKKSAKKAAGGKGQRYSAAEKQEILDFVVDYDRQHGRGGQTAAAEKYGVSPLTISNWKKNSGKAPRKMGRPKKSGLAAAVTTSKQITSGATSMGGKLDRLQSVHDEIVATEKELNRLRAQFDALKESL